MTQCICKIIKKIQQDFYPNQENKRIKMFLVKKSINN